MPGNPNGYTTNAYTPIGHLSTGWTEYKLAFNFTTDTYTVSTRTDAAGAWTPLKAAGATGYDIPMRGTADNTANTALTSAWAAARRQRRAGLDDVALLRHADHRPPPVADMPITAVDCSNCHAPAWTTDDGPNCGELPRRCPRATPARRLTSTPPPT